MFNLNILKFTKSYFIMLIVIGVACVGSFSSCKRKTTSTITPTEQFTLKITKTGIGSVSASWSGGTATDAQLTAGIKVNKAVAVTLTATPDVAMPNVLWNNATTGNTYSVTMSQDQTIPVAFSATPIVTHTLTLPADGSLIAYTDNAYTQPITDLSKIVEGTKIYLKVVAQNKIITSITGIDDGSLSTDKQTATVTMTTDKTITATLSIDITGFVFADDGSGGYRLTAYKGALTDIEIPATYNGKAVTAIGDGNAAISNLVKSVIIPNSVTSIGSYTFSYCHGLTNITIPSNVTSIGGSAFQDCWSLTSITIPNTVTSIGYAAFSNCKGLTTATIGVTAIPSSLFYNCTNLTTVNIGKNVSTIASDAFSSCSKLAALNIDGANNNFTSVNGVVYNKAITQIVLMPPTITDYVMPNTVTSFSFDGNTTLKTVIVGSGMTNIPAVAFFDCKGLTSITIPSGVTSIGGNAFHGCTGLTSIVIPSGVTSIAASTFYNSGLTSITIPSGVTSIGSNAFDGCSDLTSITIPSNVTSIGIWAFHNCSGLTSITIPSNVTSIGNGVFGNCSKLTDISVDVSNTNYTALDGVLFDKTLSTLIAYPGGKVETTYTIPSSVTSINKQAFTYSKNLTSITIPSGVMSIGQEAFYSCTGLTSVTMQGATPPTLGTNVFNATPFSLLIHVPNATAQTAYQAATNWSAYSSKIVTP